MSKKIGDRVLATIFNFVALKSTTAFGMISMRFLRHFWRVNLAKYASCT